MSRPVKNRPRISAQLLSKMTATAKQPAELNTIMDLQREWQRVHRLYWRKQIGPDEYSTAMYGLQIGVAVTRISAELEVPVMRTPNPHSLDLSKLDDEELRWLERIVLRAGPQLPIDQNTANALGQSEG